MSKYTTEVRFICENYSGLSESVGYNDVDEVIRKSRTKIFDFSYPIFDESYKPILETKILLHYYTREISEETVGLWKLRLKAKMNEIMPYFNQLYESELIKFDPFKNNDYDRIGNRNRDDANTRVNNLKRTSQDSGQDNRIDHSERGGSDVTTTNSADKFSEWNLYSDTPQGGIEGILGAEDEPSLLDNGYLTNARHILHDGTGTTSETEAEYGGTMDGTGVTQYGRKNVTDDTGNTKFNGNTTEDYIEHVKGMISGNPSQMIKDFRDTFLNIDLDIINSLKNLFFNLW